MRSTMLSEKTKELRLKKGMSQQGLAEITGLSLRSIQRIENGETEPRGDSIKRLAEAFEVTPGWLLEQTEKEDKDFLTGLNLSALSFLLFPLLAAIVPLIMWSIKKASVNTAQSGRHILNFQLTWTLLFCLGYALFIIRGFNSFTPLMPLLIFHGALYALNILMIIANTIRIRKEKEVRYFPKINFIDKTGWPIKKPHRSGLRARRWL